MKKYKVIGLCFMICISLIPISEVRAASVITDDGLYSFDRSTRRITAYNPNNLSDAPTEVVIPETLFVSGISYPVTEIGNYAFDAGDNVTKVVVANSVRSMNSAFSECPNLSEIVLGSGITELRAIIGEFLPSLRTFTIPGTVKTLSNTLPFDACDNLTELVFAEGFESILTANINSNHIMDTLKRVVLPSTMKTINANAFGANTLTEIVINQEQATSAIAANQPWGAPSATITWRGAASNLTSSQEVKVYYDPSNKIADVDNPADAQWSVVIPKAIHFREEPNGKKMNADITLKSENGHALPSGKNAVSVSVSSENAFRLKYNTEYVSYEVSYADDFGTTGILNETNGTAKMTIGTLQDGKTTIVSNAEVKTTATTTAIYKDTLTYRIAKVILP